MVDAWWSLLGAAIPAVIAGKAFRMKQKHAEEERIKSARGREKSSDDIFVCERVCTSKRMLKKVGAFSKDPIPDTCVTVCGVSELDACSDACARTVCVNQHQFPFFLEHWLLITVTAISVSKLGSLNGGGSSLEAGRDDGPRDDLDRNTKKVRFKEDNGNGDIDMIVESNSIPTLSWKDQLLGNGLDINRYIVNGILAIDFSDRIEQILFKEMETTVVLKLLGSIGYLALNNRVSSLWRPSKPFHLMDIKNKYFLPKFQCTEDFEEVLSQGPWWDYREGSQTGFNTDSKFRGRLARMVMYVNLEKPLVSQVLVNGVLLRVEYESLPTIRYTCGKYGHTKEICPLKERISMVEKEQMHSALDGTMGGGDGASYGP
ncbi:hypothetical protein Goklo_021004 [Gossypium klotzschianum]|uniref:DUF4283 domain-containing protein n=1 Tax=Gossypium klotzschianum TaxID=34286 RepID=A0A7J8UUI1_9ROSI|nr:hypothetical protein [Gossypium klotzschianum]